MNTILIKIRSHLLHFPLLLFQLLFPLLLTSYFIGCGDYRKDKITEEIITEEKDYSQVPEGLPALPVPEYNPITKESVDLGRRLFAEKIMSVDSSLACISCHDPGRAFSSSGMRVVLGYNKEPLNRNVPTLINKAFFPEYLWGGGAFSIEGIAHDVLSLPNEFNNDTLEVERRLSSHPDYPGLFTKAFGDDARPSAHFISYAISSFIRTLISGDSRYDKYIRGDSSALNDSEISGMKLFFSHKVNCSKCHSGPLFTDFAYHNTGTTTHYFDRGRFYVTNNPYDRGKFRTPSLRNCGITGPYMHDGEKATLEIVLDNYNRGGRLFIHKDTLMKPLGLDKQEIKDIVAFLHSLTDEEFIERNVMDFINMAGQEAETRRPSWYSCR